MEAHDVAKDLQTTDADQMAEKYLTFWLGKQLFGISIDYVVQIVGMQLITEIPEYPDYAKGIINLRGSIIPLIDVRLRLGKAETEYSDRTCIIVVDIHSCYFGMIVDEVDEVVDVPGQAIAEPPRMGENRESQYMMGVAHLQADEDKTEKIILLMDSAKLLGEKVMEILSQTAK